MSGSSEDSHRLSYGTPSGQRRAMFNKDMAAYGFAALLLSGIWHVGTYGASVSVIAVKYHQPSSPMPTPLHYVDSLLAGTSIYLVSAAGCSIICLVCTLCYVARRRGVDLRATSVLAYGLAILLLIFLVCAAGVILYTIPLI